MAAGISCATNMTLAFAYHQWLQWFCFFTNGMCMGMHCAFFNILLFILWGKEVGPFMQITWSAMGFGTMIAPIIVGSFLPYNSLLEASVKDSTLQPVLTYSFSLLACLQAIDCLSWLACWLFYPDTPHHPSRNLTANHEPDAPSKEKQQPIDAPAVETAIPAAKADDKTEVDKKRPWRLLILSLHLFCQHVYFGIEVAFGSFLTTFAMRSPQHLSQAEGAKLTSIFWGVFTFTKLPAILYMQMIGSATNVMLGLAVSMAGTAALIVGGDHDYIMLLTGTIIVSAGLSSIYASMMRYLEDFMPVDQTIGALSGVFLTLGEFTFPFVIGFFIEDHPLILTYSVLFSCVCMSTLFPVIMMLCKSKLSKSGDRYQVLK